MSLDPLVYRLQRETVMYRKGPAVEVREAGGHRVTEIWGYPPTPERGQLVDVHFVNVGFTEAASDKDGFVADLTLALGPGEYETLTAEDWAEGPSYIAIGAWIGSQDLALRLIALGRHYGCWEVITPGSMGITDREKADAMAGAGFVLCSGWRP
jgi:hypothetical protein